MASKQYRLPLDRRPRHTLLRQDSFMRSKSRKVAEDDSRLRVISRSIEKRCQVVRLDPVVMRLNTDEIGLLAGTSEHCRCIFYPSESPRLHHNSNPWIGCEGQTCALRISIGPVYRDEELKLHTALVEH